MNISVFHFKYIIGTSNQAFQIQENYLTPSQKSYAVITPSGRYFLISFHKKQSFSEYTEVS